MGIADRDYARVDSAARGPGGGTGRGRHGRFRAWSVTTWIIAINVVVFLFANVILQKNLHRIDAGFATLKGIPVTDAQIRDAVVDARVQQVPGQPYFFGHPAFDARTGQHIGYRRFLEQPVLEAFGHFSTGKVIEGQIWRFLTFQFLHADITHLLFNMLGLWFVGGLVEEYLGGKRYLAFYLLCGIFGGLMYMLLNLLGYIVFQMAPGLKDQVPALLFDDVFSPLIGASAGVFGVLLAAAYIAPKSIVDVLFVIPMRLRTAVYLFVGLAMLNLLRGGHNAGGDAAHIGGAIAGAYFIRHSHLLREFFDIFGSSRVTPRRRVSESSRSELDRLLDKVRDEGLESLTEGEKKTLRRLSQGAA